DGQPAPLRAMEGLPHLFPSLSKIKIEAFTWTSELQELLESVAGGHGPGQLPLQEVLFEFCRGSPCAKGMSQIDLMKVSNLQGLKTLGITLDPSDTTLQDPHPLQPILQHTQLERLYLETNFRACWQHEVPSPEDISQLLVSLPRLNFLHMLTFPAGLTMNVPSLSMLHIGMLRIQELHELKQSLSRSSLPSLRAVVPDVLEMTILPSFSSDEACKLSPDLLKGFPLDLSTTTLLVGSPRDVLDAEQLLLAVSSLVSVGFPMAEIKSLQLENSIVAKSPVPPGVMSSLACVLPRLTGLTLVGYWDAEPMCVSPVRHAMLCFQSLKELLVITSQEYYDKVFEVYDCLYDELESWEGNGLLPADLSVCAALLDVDSHGPLGSAEATSDEES
ncbi:hypothetical protein DUNSADRAFT_1522, partial [Dunaliella salina]